MIGCKTEGRKSRLLCTENFSSLKVYLSCQKSQILTYKLLSVFPRNRRAINLNFSTQIFCKMQGMRHTDNNSIYSNTKQHQQKLWKSHVQTQIKQLLLTLPVQQQ